VKTGTGFFGLCNSEQVATLVKLANGRIKVKASGGIRTLADCARMLRAGAERIGTSAGVAIMQELQAAK
jgi:deoxyribose-phosphate aldolase